MLTLRFHFSCFVGHLCSVKLWRLFHFISLWHSDHDVNVSILILPTANNNTSPNHSKLGQYWFTTIKGYDHK